MYQVLIDGNVLFDTRFDDYKLTNAKLSLQVNKAGNFIFSIYPSNPSYDNIQKLKSHIEVYQDNVLIFGGRVLNDTIRFDNRKDVMCEGYLAYFNDSVIRPYSFNGTITEYLTLMLNEHNAQVDSNKQFTLGNVTVTDPNNFITRSNINHTKSWQELNNKLLDLLGGFLIVRVEGGVKYLDYLEDSIYMSSQKIELGKNLLDTIQERRSDEIITALIPLGAKLKDENGNDTDERLTVESVNGGLDYIVDSAAVTEYGTIFDTVVYDDVTVASNLLSKANQELAIRVNLGVSVELKAIDLSMIPLVRKNIFDVVAFGWTNPITLTDTGAKTITELLEMGQTYSFSAHFQNNISSYVRIRMDEYDASNNITYTFGNHIAFGASGVSKIENFVLKPTTVRVDIVFQRGALTGTHFVVSNIQIEKGAAATSYEPYKPSLDEIRVFEYVQVTSKPHNIDTMALITKMEIDLLSPQNNALQFGFNYQTFTEKQVKADNVIRQIQSDYVTNETISNVNNELVVLTSQILQTAESIIQQVAENYATTGQLGSIESSLVNQIETNATQTLQTFSELETTVELVDGKYVTKFNELETYVRTSIDGIELGETNSPFKLKISNDRISFLENNNEVAYISNSTLNITDGAFFTSLQIGNFEWFAEADGSLSLVKVV